MQDDNQECYFLVKSGTEQQQAKMRHESGLYAALLCPEDIKTAVFKATEKKELLKHENNEESGRISSKMK